MNENKSSHVMPVSKEAEMMVLGCMLSNDNYMKIGASSLDDADFFYQEHRTIFSVLKSAHKSDKPADVHLICEELKRIDQLKNAGGAGYITTLVQYAGTSAYLEEYIEDVKRIRMLRGIIQIAQNITTEASQQKDPFIIATKAQEDIRALERYRKLNEKFPMQFLHQFESNFLIAEPPKKPMLLEFSGEKGKSIGFLPKNIVAMLAGAGGFGKTHFLAQLAIAIASGTPFLDVFSTTSQCGKENKGNVFLGLGENQYEDIHRVLYKASKKLRKQRDLLKEDPLIEASKRIMAFSFCGQQAAFIENHKPSRYFYDFKRRLIDQSPSEGWSIIILDPASRLLGAEAEVDNASATAFIALMEELTMELPGNPTVLFAHHVNKAAIQQGDKQDQSAARGSSALTDGVRMQLLLAKEKDKNNLTILKMVKSNFTAIPEPIYLEKEEDGFLVKALQLAHRSDQHQKSNPIKGNLFSKFCGE